MNMSTQQINNNAASLVTSTRHVKVSHNDEFRRFTLQTLSFAHLEETLRTLYSLDNALLKVKFQDDENDWVLMSSDQELQYAAELSGNPLRLRFQVEGEVKPEPEVKPEALEVEEAPQWGFGRGRGGRGRGRGRRNMSPPVQERLGAKSSRISERIAILEKNLKDPNVTSERERVMLWRLEKLKGKLSMVQEKQTSFANSSNGIEQPSASEDTPQEASPWKGRGRGCGGRAGCRGRGSKFANVSITPLDQDAARDALAEFRQAKVTLKVARKSGDSEAIATSEAAFRQAQQKKKESLAVLLAPQRVFKRECFLKLKEAQRNGDEEAIKAAQQALADAMNNLKKVKAELLN
jgi:hypothetical protein